MNSADLHKKCLEFVSWEQKEAITTRKSILIALERTFGYNHSWFLLSGSPRPCVAHNLDNHMVNDYITCYCRMHPYRKPGSKNGDVITTGDIISQEDYEDSEYYRDFISRYNLYYAANVPVHNANGVCLGCISVFRSQRQGDFSHTDREALSWVGKYAAVVLNRQMESNRSRDYGILLEASLQGIQFGYLLLDENYNTLFFNAAARDFAGQLAAGQKKVYSRNPIEALKEIIFTKLNVLQGLPSKPWSFTSGPYVINGYPIFPYTSSVNVALKRHVICVTRGEAAQGGEARQILAQFGLTNREKEVVKLLQQGFSNQRIAKELCISENTAKVHLRNIYAKMEVSSRSEVLAILSSHMERPRMVSVPGTMPEELPLSAMAR